MLFCDVVIPLIRFVHFGLLPALALQRFGTLGGAANRYGLFEIYHLGTDFEKRLRTCFTPMKSTKSTLCGTADGHEAM